MSVVKVETLKCTCGRPKAAAQKHVQHIQDIHFTYYLCDCGQEWTLEERDVNPRDPVTSEEVLRVHELLQPDSDLSLKDLLG